MEKIHWISTPAWLLELGERMEVPVIRVGIAQRWLNAGTDIRGTVIVGQPLLDALSADELRTVLAHELGHAKVSRSFFAVWAMVETAAAMRKLKTYFDDTHPLLLLMNWEGLNRVFYELMRPARWVEEHGADVIAAAYVGRDAAIATLIKLGHLQGGLGGSDEDHPPLLKRIGLLYLLTVPALPAQPTSPSQGYQND